MSRHAIDERDARRRVCPYHDHLASWRGRRVGRLFTVGLILSTIMVVGCDLGTYDERSSERLEFLTEQTRLAGLLRTEAPTQLKNTELQDTGITVCHPTIFVADQGLLGDQMANRAPKRVFPPGIEIPGFTYTHESYRQTQEGIFLSFYVYHGMISKSDLLTTDDVKAAIEANISAAIPNLRYEWESVDLAGLSGNTVNWERMKLTLGQEFAFYEQGDSDVEYRQTQGHLVFGVHSTENYHVVMAWRVPAEIAAELEFLEAADACMGTLTVSQGS